MSEALYRRTCTVEVQRQDGQTVTVSGARVAFKVERDEQLHANTAEVRVWNLASTTRSGLTLPCVVTLTAGYLGTPTAPGSTGTLFRGACYDVVTERQGADTVTVLKATDRASGTVALSRKGQTAWAAVAQAMVAAVADATGVRAGNASVAIGRASGDAYPRGYSYRGPALRGLDEVLLRGGLRASVQSGELLVLEAASSAGGEVVSLSADTGLVGSPTLAERPAPGSPPPTAANPQRGHLIRARLSSRLVPGSVVDVRSVPLTGQFRVRAVSHVGDLEGQEWTTEVEVIP